MSYVSENIITECIHAGEKVLKITSGFNQGKHKQYVSYYMRDRRHTYYAQEKSRSRKTHTEFAVSVKIDSQYRKISF